MSITTKYYLIKLIFEKCCVFYIVKFYRMPKQFGFASSHKTLQSAFVIRCAGMISGTTGLHGERPLGEKGIVIGSGGFN